LLVAAVAALVMLDLVPVAVAVQAVTSQVQLLLQLVAPLRSPLAAVVPVEELVQEILTVSAQVEHLLHLAH